MSRAVVLIWLGTVGARDPHEPDLTGWAASRMVTLEDPGGDRGLAVAEHDDRLATRVEGLLSEARTAGYAAEPGAAEAALDSAELLLRGNPSLPEAPWLMAETCRHHAALVVAHDPALSAILERRATVLEGQRAPAFGTSDRPLPSGDASTQAVLEGPLPSDEVDLDGVAMREARVIPEGEHHVRVLRHGQLVWAGWVTPEASTYRIPLPPIAPCSEADFEPVRNRGSQVATGGGVLCPRWAVARDAGTSRIEVSLCERSACGTFLPWSREWGKDLEGPMHPPWPQPASRSWIAWTAASVTALAVGAVVLWQAGAFEKQGPPEESLRFTAVPPPP